MKSISDIRVGDVDAKNEVLHDLRTGDDYFERSFFINKNFKLDEFEKGIKCFVIGSKGSGKTAFLRYLKKQEEKKGGLTDFILFRSEITEQDKIEANRAGVTQIEFHPESKAFLGVDTDYRSYWKWFILERIYKVILKNEVNADISLSEFCKYMMEIDGNNTDSLFDRIRGGKMKVDAKLAAVQFSIETKDTKQPVDVEVSTLAKKALQYLIQAKESLNKDITIFIDELELCKKTEDQYKRDIRLIGDLVLTTENLNRELAEAGILNIKTICAIRSEVLKASASIGYELMKPVEDQGLYLDWHSTTDNTDVHPLFRLMLKKISPDEYNEFSDDADKVNEALIKYFPDNRADVGHSLKYFTNYTFYRPRDVVRLLKCAAEKSPDSENYSVSVLKKGLSQYSELIWDEIREELAASYTAQEISSIKKLLSGFKQYFVLHELKELAERKACHDGTLSNLLATKTLDGILSDMFRIGLVGNKYKMGRYLHLRWSYRGDDKLIFTENMMLHNSVVRALDLG